MKFYTASQLIKQYEDVIVNHEREMLDLYDEYNRKLSKDYYVEVKGYYTPSMLHNSALFKKAQPQTKEDFEVGYNIEYLDKFLKGEALRIILVSVEQYQKRNISVQHEDGLHRLVIFHELLSKDVTTELLNNDVKISIDDEHDLERIFVSLFEHHASTSESDPRFYGSVHRIHYFAKDERDTDDQSPYKFEKGSILTLKLDTYQKDGLTYPIITAHIENSFYTGIVSFDELLQNSELYHKIKEYAAPCFLTRNTKEHL